MMAEEVDILHPLSAVDTKHHHLHSSFHSGDSFSVQCVLLHDKLYMLYDSPSGFEPASTKLGVYHFPNLNPSGIKLKEELEAPMQDCCLTTYKSKLVVIGGFDHITGEMSNVVWTSDTGHNWQRALPPMPTPCFKPSVLSIEDPECLIVMEGIYWESHLFFHEFILEVLMERHWSSIRFRTQSAIWMSQPLTLHEERVYASAMGVIFYVDLKVLIDSCTQPKHKVPHSLWREIEMPSGVEVNPPPHFTSFGQRLICVDNTGNGISAYSLLTESWIPVGDHVEKTAVHTSIKLSNDSIFTVGCDDYDLFAGIWSLKVCPYDRMGTFTECSLFKLEHAGVKIVTSLLVNFGQLLSEIGVSMEVEKLDVNWINSLTVLKQVIVIWGQKEHLTWALLLEVLAKMNLTRLGQQIEEYLTGTKQYLDAYQQILATQDSIKMWFFKVILLGAPRLGKTTACRRLTGEIEDISSSGETVEPSTGAVESGHSVAIRNLSSTTALMTQSEWLANKDLSEEIVMFLEFFLDHVGKKSATSPALETIVATSVIQSEVPQMMSSSTEQQYPIYGQQDASHNQQDARHAQQNAGHDQQDISCDQQNTSHKQDSNHDTSLNNSHTKLATASLPAASVSSVLESSVVPPGPLLRSRSQIRTEITDMFREALGPSKWKEVKHLFTDTAFIKMEDTGGQPEFMDMLSALTVGPALYLLFCKLTDTLQSRYKVSYLSASGESTLSRESTYTVEEVFFKALASITCSQSSSSSLPTSSLEVSNPIVDQLMASCNKSIAYIVGTHKDLVSEEQIKKFDQKLQESVCPTSFFHDDIVQFSSRSEQRMVLPVDNMHGGSSEINKIRKLLEDALKKHFKQLSIPASWLVLSLCLRKREERTASLQSVLLLAEEIGIPKNETMIALWFLHHYAGVLMYFPNLPELKDTVICDNQVIYDSATSIIVKSFQFGPDSVGKAASDWFSKTGQFSLEDIRKATASISGDYIPLEKLVKLLEHLNILASLVRSHLTAIASCTQSSKQVHFMPCVLQNTTHEELAKFWNLCDTPDQLTIAPLLIRYKCGFVPIGVFPAMIASLSANKSLKIKVEGLKKNRVQFHIGRDFDVVTLISQPKYYAVHIARRQSTRSPSVPAHEVCATVRRLVESTLQTVTSQMNYHFSAEYQLAFECPSHPGREHLCVVECDEASPCVMCCLENLDDLEPVDMLDHHLIWFKKSPSEDTNRDVSDTLKPATAVASCPSCRTRSSVQASSPSHDQAQQPDRGLSIDSKPKLHQLHCLKTEDKQLRVAQTVGVDWIQLGLSLHFEYNVIRAIERDNCNRTRESCLELLGRWLEGEACHPITWARLIEALRDAEHGTLADDLKQYFAAL